MYLLDTNVVSELRRASSCKADKHVTAWARSVPAVALYLSVVTLLELEVGVRQMERRDAAQGKTLRKWMDESIQPAFEGRILPVDTAVVLQCAQLHVPDPRPYRDALIAATALVHGLVIVTRDEADFGLPSLQLLNPWRQNRL